MSGRRRLVLFCFVTALGVVADQLTKMVARAFLVSRPPISLLGGTVVLVHGENVGAFMGLGAALPPPVRTLLFGVFAALLLVIVSGYILRTPGLTGLDVVAGALLVAGGVGNLIDRVMLDGGVTDFVVVGVGRLRTGVFNVADVFIVAGVGWYLFSLIPRERAQRREAEA